MQITTEEIGGDPVTGSLQAEFISIQEATKVYDRGSVVAFENMTFSVQEHEIVTIVGPSGCGKTSLLRCIDGLIPLTSGSVRIGGDLVTEPDPRVAMVFQHFGLFPWQTVEKNVGFGLRNQRVPKSEWKVAARKYIDLVNLSGFEEAYPYHLSGGMRQRVGLARALAVEPEVLLMDEPFASVDAMTREQLQQQLMSIWDASPRTMIFITHSIEEAVLMGDRVVVMGARPGKVKEIIDIPFGHPRVLTDLRADLRIPDLRNHIWELLRTEGASIEAPSD